MGNTPSFQDKEERRLITLASMDNLLRFHEIERQEKHNALKFYSAFIGGGIALIIGMGKISSGIDSAILKFVAITIIILIDFLMIKKLIAVRGASNNIYHEYGRRLRFLINSHSSDLDKTGLKEIKGTFQKYIDEQKPAKLLPKYSADTYEVYGLFLINVLFSLSYFIPISDIYVYFGLVSDSKDIFRYPNFSMEKVVFFFSVFFLFSITIFFGFYIIVTSPSMPNVTNRKLEGLEWETRVFDLDGFEEFRKVKNSHGEYVDVFEKLRIVCVSGGFDPIHKGHISHIKEAKKLGDILIVILNGDDFLISKKGAAFMNLDDRALILSAIEGVDFVVRFNDLEDRTVCKPLSSIKPDIFAKGGDRKDEKSIPEWTICQELGIKICTNIGDDEFTSSSSSYLNNWVRNFK